MGRKKRPTKFGIKLSELIEAGLLKAPMRLFRKYKGKMLEGRLLPDGQVESEGEVCRTCSTAAEKARASVMGHRLPTNGWSFWQFDSGSGRPKTLEEVRTTYLAMKAQV